MALNRLENIYRLTESEKNFLDTLLPHEKDHWTLKNSSIDAIKGNIRDHLRLEQREKCCYCGGTVRETSSDHIDHVAPKSKHPEFTFNTQNLVLSCSFCNGFEKKGSKETIHAPKNAIYEHNAFIIVHPVFDIPSDHIKISSFQVEGLTSKGIESIKMFKLHEERQLRSRRKMALADRFEQLPNFLKSLIDRLI